MNLYGLSQKETIAAICRQIVLEDEIDYVPELSIHEYVAPAIEGCGFKY